MTFRVFGDTLDPDAISTMMGATPSWSYQKGEVKLLRNGKHLVRKTGAWAVSVADREPEAVDAQVAELLSLMTPDLSVWKRLSEEFDLDMFCGLFMNQTNEGFSLSIDTLRALADRGIEIGFDTYAPLEQHDDASS